MSNKRTEVILNGEKHEFFLSNAAARQLAVKYGTYTKAEKALREVTFVIDGSEVKPRANEDYFTPDFFDVFRDFYDALLLAEEKEGIEKIDFDDLDTSDLSSIIQGVWETLVANLPKAKEGSEVPQKPRRKTGPGTI